MNNEELLEEARAYFAQLQRPTEDIFLILLFITNPIKKI